MYKTMSDYQEEFDRLAQEALLALGIKPTDDERKMLRYYGLMVLTGLEPGVVSELAEVAYECARDHDVEHADCLAEMFFRGFALARYVSRSEEEEKAEVVYMN